jgi:hypothetical protein
MDTVKVTEKKLTASALLKKFGLSIEDAESLLNQIYDTLEANQEDGDENTHDDESKAE